MNKLVWFALPIVPAVLSTGCPLLQVDTEVSEVCVTYHDVVIEGVPGQGDGPTELATSVTIDDLGQLTDLVDQDDDLAFVRAEIRATDGTDLGFVDAANVSIASGDPDSVLPTLSVVACDGDCLPNGAVLEIPAAIQHSAVDYVRTGSLAIDLDIVGRAPATDWTADVDVCMTGHLTYKLEP